MHIHLIAVCGTGMGSLAGLLKQAGHRVTGSDATFLPPMSTALAEWGIETMDGFKAENLSCKPDLVVVGNVCRSTNIEARAAIDGEFDYVSFPELMERLFLTERESFVVAGTHGKTTTTTLLAYLLDKTGNAPGFLIGGIPNDFDASFRVGDAAAPFAIEGDEYDCAFFEKKPKFWRYNPKAAILTSIEHDHIDIYPDIDSYRAAFDGFVGRIPEDGLLVAFAGDPEVRRAASKAKCRVVYYALEDDDWGDVVPVWVGATVAPQGGAQPFDMFLGGTSVGRVMSPMIGAHNTRNTLAAVALIAEMGRGSVRELTTALWSFRGIKRRQELLAEVRGVRVYDDFAHHPTAVRETLKGIRARHPEGRLIAVFEPRSATASRNLHQDQYPGAFAAADYTWLAPVGRKEISDSERLDRKAIAELIRGEAKAPDSIEDVITQVSAEVKEGDTVVVMSNGAFDNFHDRLITELALS